MLHLEGFKTYTSENFKKCGKSKEMALKSPLSWQFVANVGEGTKKSCRTL